MFGQLIACFVGVGISKLFALNPNAEHYAYLGGALACSTTTFFMVLTKTVHPPAGATALLAVTNTQTRQLGWFLFPVIILGVSLMQTAALVINNIQRRFPVYWWTPQSLAPSRRDEERPEKETPSVPSHYDGESEVPRRIVLEHGDIQVPNGVYLTADEREALRKISKRL